MGGLELTLIVGLVAILIGAGIGYLCAAGSYAANLFAVVQSRQELERKLAGAQSNEPPASADNPEGSAAPVQPLALTRAPWEPMSGAVPGDDATLSDAHAASAEFAPGTVPPAVAPLTGPATEGQGGATLRSFVAVAHQAGALLMIDIDHLGVFRERYGSQLAEYVQNHVERLIREALLDTSAVVSRYEDQEFLVALPESRGNPTEKLLAARRTASELRGEIQRSFLQVGNERLTITVSIGLAMMDIAVGAERVIARADEALHAAKRAGRNRGCYYHAGQCLPVDPLVENPDPITGEEIDEIQSRLNSPSKRVACRDRRKHVRMPCYSVNLIAPCQDDVVPAIDKFERVQFLDLSVNGFSMIMPAIPAADRFCVAMFNNRGMIFMSASVVNIRQAPRAGHIKPLVIVGCQFLRRLNPDHPMPNLFHQSTQHDPRLAAVLQSL